MAWVVQSGTEYTTSNMFASLTNGTATISCPNTCTVGDIVSLNSTVGNFIQYTQYFVIATSLSASGFQLSTTPGGGAQTPNATGLTITTIEHVTISDTTNNTYYAQVDTSSIAPAITGGVINDILGLRIYTYDTGQTT